MELFCVRDNFSWKIIFTVRGISVRCGGVWILLTWNMTVYNRNLPAKILSILLIIHLFSQKRIELNYLIPINLLASYRNMLMHAKLCIVWRESVAAPLIVSVYKTLIVTIKLCTVLYCTVLYCNVTIKHRILLTKLLSWHDWSPISWGATLTFTIIVLTMCCTLGKPGGEGKLSLIIAKTGWDSFRGVF